MTVPTLARAVLLICACDQVAASELFVGGKPATYAEAERLLRTPSLEILDAAHNPKSATASTIELELHGGWHAKVRLVADMAASTRNEDPKLDVAAYEVSRWLFPQGGCVYPSVLRRIDPEALRPHLDPGAAARLDRWSGGGHPWIVLSLVGEHAVRAAESPWFGGWAAPEPEVLMETLPPAYFRALGAMNVLAVLVHNGDMRAQNWEIRHEDGACFIVDHGVSFVHDDWVVPHRLWRHPCELLAPALAASTVARLRQLVAAPEELDAALSELQGSPFGLPPEARRIVPERAEQLLRCLDEGEHELLDEKALMARLRSGEMRPLRDRLGRRQPVVVVADW